jgi:hypothetical protein
MLVKRLLQLNLIVSAIIAIAFIALPGPTLGLYGISNDAAPRAIAQYFGTAHLSFAILIWYALRSHEASFVRAVVRSFFAGDLAGTIVLLSIQLRGVMNAMGWELVGLTFLFSVGWGICTIRRIP